MSGGIVTQKLIYRLYELTKQIERCTHVQRDTLKNALHTQDCANERVNQSKHHAGVVMTQVDNDLQNVEEEKIKVINQLKKCTQATEISHATLNKGESAVQNATDTLNHWNRELQKALAWLKQAETRLEQAIQEYRAAQNDLQSAKNNLERTEANLRRCINDSERKNCDREASNYDSAKREALQLKYTVSMQDSAWYQKQLEEMEETLSDTQQPFRTLQDERKDIRNIWNDRAADDISSRYLNPHEESSDQILQQLQEQQRVLQQLHRLLTSATSQTVEVNKLSEEIVRLLKITQQELQPSYSNYDVYFDNNSEASSLLPKVDELIRQANNVCG